MRIIFRFLLFSIVAIVSSSFAQQSPRIFLIGDSTVADKPVANDNPERGWGQLLPEFVSLEIKNYAVNGRSTKSFIAEGRWDSVLQVLRAGDWVFIQFGHNDQKTQDSTRYAAPHTLYKTNLIRFVQDASAKGARPVLITPVMRRKFDEQGNFIDQHGDYPNVMKEVAASLQVPLIDLHALSKEVIVHHGVEKSKDIFLWIAPGINKTFPEGKTDNTHFSLYGARIMASLVADEIKSLGLDIPLRGQRPK
jgi:DNA sulfur modification protein DndE